MIYLAQMSLVEQRKQNEVIVGAMADTLSVRFSKATKALVRHWNSSPWFPQQGFASYARLIGRVGVYSRGKPCKGLHIFRVGRLFYFADGMELSQMRESPSLFRYIAPIKPPLPLSESLTTSSSVSV